MSFVYKKETEHSLELALSICVFYRRIFNLESKTLIYKTTQDERAPAILLMDDIY